MNLGYKATRCGSVTAVAVAAALAIAACGSGSSTSTTSSSAAAARTGVRNPAQRAKLVACLKQHGVTLPSRPGVPGAGTGAPGSAPPAGGAPARRRGQGFFFGGAGANPKVRTALQACGANFGGARFGAGVSPAARQAAIAKFVTCVRQHGYNLPKPNLSGNGPVFPVKIESKPKFVAASRACASLLTPPRGAAPAPPGSSSSA